MSLFVHGPDRSAARRNLWGTSRTAHSSGVLRSTILRLDVTGNLVLVRGGVDGFGVEG